MSDKRRRRVNSDDSEGSEGEGEGEVKLDKVGSEELDIEKDEGVDSAPEPEQGDSEYESADDDIEIVDEILNNKDELDGGGEEPYPGIDREEGDGEETPSSPTILDDDEDKKNPQYIPKRGMFYEHDDRIDPADEVEGEGEEEEKPDLKKKIWKADAAEKWGHDKFMEMEQTPKNQDELVAAYGYDIRDEDNAPRARRRRRYGRGPNKYTRNWEDEDAYVKPAAPRGRGVAPVRGVTRGGKSVMIEDFPALPNKDEEEEEEYEREPLKREKSMTEIKPERKPEFKREKSTPEFKTNRERDDRNRNNRNSREKDDESFLPRRGRGRGDFNGGRGGDNYGGGRGQGFGRGRGRDDQFNGRGGGRGGRGGYDGYDQPRGGRGGRGGFDDRGRGGGDRRMREENNRNYQGGVNDNEYRGGGRGRGGRGRGRGMEDRHHEGGIGNRRQNDQGVNGKPDDLSDDVAHMDLNKDNENSNGNRGAKRYSNQRRGGPDHSNVNHNLQEMYAEGIDPSLCSGPPSGPPFQTPMSNTRLSMNTAVSQSGMGTVPASFIAPSQAILNYGPQFQVPVTAVSLGLGAVVTSGLPLTAIPNLAGTITTGVGMPLMAADPMLLAAAHGPDSFTDIRGGVTYFNPTAQNFLPQRQMSKRAKAPIAIVDPSQQRGNSVPKEETANHDINLNGVKKEDSLPIESNIASSESTSSELTAEQ